ncbi:MAG: hypothetical protein VW707_00880, partial [Candidatus Puniceispirillum sp.]
TVAIDSYEFTGGAHGLPVVFLHPKDFQGTLIELEQVTGKGTQ